MGDIDLIQETKDYISALGYKKDDIAWIGGYDFTIPINCFWDSPPQYYYPGYGSAEVATDLRIVFKDNSWLERREYDGSEWWEHQVTPQRPQEEKFVKYFTARDAPRDITGYDLFLKEINGGAHEMS